jgi:hypothetical protein
MEMSDASEAQRNAAAGLRDEREAGQPSAPSSEAITAALQQVVADAGPAAAAALEALESRLSAKLEALRAGLGSRPLLSLSSEGDDIFDRLAPRPAASVETEAPLQGTSSPSLQAQAQEEGSVQAEAADMVPAADALRLARMVQDMASFGLRSGEAEWKNRPQASPNFDYFA